ncbi:MAG: phytanoyl-CoA dioxygenase family protein [Bacteroidota bacterium]
MDAKSLLSTLNKNGFVKITGLLNAGQIQTLQTECSRLLQYPAASWDNYIQYSDRQQWESAHFSQRNRSRNYFDFIGLSSDLDDILNSVIGHRKIDLALRKNLGPKFRLWFAQIRQSTAHSKHLRIHQDLRQEVSLCILVEDAPTKAGATVFLPGSHRWPRILPFFPFLTPGMLDRFTTGATGKAGDIYLFLNDTWHGRNKARSQTNTSLLLSFLPIQKSPKTRWAPSELVNKQGPALRKVMSQEN